jgi:hypothetical protein
MIVTFVAEFLSIALIGFIQGHWIAGVIAPFFWLLLFIPVPGYPIGPRLIICTAGVLVLTLIFAAFRNSSSTVLRVCAYSTLGVMFVISSLALLAIR